MNKHLIIGLGMVGSSFLRIVKEKGCFFSDRFYCIDSDPAAEAIFVDLGGDKDHFLCVTVNEKNYKSLLGAYGKGDYIFDFSCEVKNIDMLAFSLEHGLHYISTADSNWDLNDIKWVSVHQHFLEYRDLAKHRDRKTYTSIIEFGMNPGLVSCFAKKCLKMIVETDSGSYISSRREMLKHLLSKGQYSKVARKIGLEYIVEVDHDNQIFDVEPQECCIYSPWNPLSFYHEGLSAPEMIFGTWKQFRQFNKVRDCDFLDLSISLMKPGIDCKEHVYSPQGEVQGSLIAHEEIFSMSYFFRRGLYKPASFFVYKPSELAEQTLSANRDCDSPEFAVLDRDVWKSGGESVGVILQGRKFHSAYFGNYLDGNCIDETSTIRQVSASTFAAYRYIQNHPREGFLFPEEVDEEEMLTTAGEYLFEYVFTKCNPVMPCFGKR